MSVFPVFFENANLKWIDVRSPSEEDIQSLIAIYNLPARALEDCMDTRHLPKFEKIDNRFFFITRVLDPDADFSQSSIQEFTRKIAIFVWEGQIITIHRMTHPFLEEIHQDLNQADPTNLKPSDVILAIFGKAISSFDSLLDTAEEHIEVFESALFENQEDAMNLQKVHYIRRKLFGIKRLLMHHLTMIQRVTATGEVSAPAIAGVKEHTDHFLFYSDELLEDVNQLLNLQVSLSTKRTNEVVRILTVFSVFFMPLTFIVGVYGMNFDNIPEFHWENGYLFVWLVMIGVTAAIFFWFRKRKYL